MSPPPAPGRAPNGPPATGRALDDLPATVRALGWTSFLTDFSSEAIYPILPAFVRGLGGTGIEVGLIDGLANAVAAVVRLPSGIVSDAVGRRPLVLLGYGISALVRPLVAVATAPLHVLVVRSVDRVGKGIRAAPRDALVADLVGAADRSRAFGHIRALDHAGAAAGPLAAMLFLLAWPGQERLLFLLALLPGLATFAVIWRFVHDPPGRVRTLAAPAVSGRLSRGQAALLGCVAVWALGASSEHFLLMRAADLGMPPALIPLAWFGTSLAKSGSAAQAGRVARLLSPRAALVAGWLVFAAAYGGLALAEGLPATLGLLGLVGVASGIAEPAERTLVATLAPAGGHGNAFGWYALVQGLMALPAGLLAGWLWTRGPQGPQWAFATTAALTAAAACGLALRRRPGA